MRRRKFNNIPTEVDGYKLDSKAEAKRYVELRFMEKAKRIKDLEVHPKFVIHVNDQKICLYEADFAYKDDKGEVHVEDVKGCRTALFILKKKLLKAVMGLEVEEVRV